MKPKTPLTTGAQAADALGGHFEHAAALLLGADISARTAGRQDLRLMLAGQPKTVEVKSIRDSLSRGWRVIESKASDYAMLWLWHEPSSGRGRSCAEYYGTVEAMLKFAAQSVTGVWLLPFAELAVLREAGARWRGARHADAWREVRVAAVRRLCAGMQPVTVDWLVSRKHKFSPFPLWNKTELRVEPAPF